jgi:hypothetical protein
VLSLVTADSALAVAQDHAGSSRRALVLRHEFGRARYQARCRAAVEAAGGRYVDVAVLAPVNPARLKVPLLVSGPARRMPQRRCAKPGSPMCAWSVTTSAGPARSR